MVSLCLEISGLIDFRAVKACVSPRMRQRSSTPSLNSRHSWLRACLVAEQHGKVSVVGFRSRRAMACKQAGKIARMVQGWFHLADPLPNLKSHPAAGLGCDWLPPPRPGPEAPCRQCETPKATGDCSLPKTFARPDAWAVLVSAFWHDLTGDRTWN